MQLHWLPTCQSQLDPAAVFTNLTSTGIGSLTPMTSTSHQSSMEATPAWVAMVHSLHTTAVSPVLE